MTTEIAHKYYKALQNDHFSYIYLGNFDDELTYSISHLNETSIVEPKNLRNKLSFLISECFQNIIRHADKPELVTRTNNKPSMFIIRNIKNSFFIGSTNLIDNSKKDLLQAKLRTINTLSQNELKEIYLNSLSNDNVSEKGGAGLGLITMAQRSGCSLEFDFEFLNYFLSVFFIQVVVKTKKEQSEDDLYEFAENTTMDKFKDLYKQMVEEDVLMIRKGDFSQEAILPLLNIIETNLSTNSKWHGIKKKIIYLLIEMLQNISKHGKETNGIRDGIFVITKKHNHFTIITGNFIDNSNVEALENHLNSLIDLDEAALKEMYNNTLLRQDTVETKSAGIGLIEIMKFGTKKLSYTFTQVNDIESFFSVCITI